MNEDLLVYLVEMLILDFFLFGVQWWLLEFVDGFLEMEKVVEFYFLVCELVLYDLYYFDFCLEFLKVLVVFGRWCVWCVEKLVLLVVLLWVFGIFVRLGFGIVKNYIGVEKLLYYLKRLEIVFYGFVEVFLNGIWIKCMLVFDQKICWLVGVELLDWDGKSDLLFQEFLVGKWYMEYLKFYGSFLDVFFVLMYVEMKLYYLYFFIDYIVELGFLFYFIWELFFM